jgi:hypothetical protein
MDGDEITLGDHPMHLDVDRPDRGKVILGCLQAVRRLGFVLDVVVDDQVVERVSVSDPEGFEEVCHRMACSAPCLPSFSPGYSKRLTERVRLSGRVRAEPARTGWGRRRSRRGVP